MTLDEQLAQRADAAFNNRLGSLLNRFKADLLQELSIPFADSIAPAVRMAVDALRDAPSIAEAIDAKRAAYREQFIKGVVDGLLASKVVA